MNPVFEFLNGKTYKYRGISGTFRHTYYTDRLGILRQKLYHEPDANGKRTKAYQETKAELRDDWDADLSDNIDAYCEAAHALGYGEAE